MREHKVIVNGKEVYRVIPDELGLLTVARVTLPEKKEERLSKARNWFGANSMWGDREIFLLNAFWDALESAPEQVSVDRFRSSARK